LEEFQNEEDTELVLAYLLGVQNLLTQSKKFTTQYLTKSAKMGDFEIE